MGRERLEAEFGVYARWLADAIATLIPKDPIPAACRGTGNPVLFEALADALLVTARTRFLDVGCGIGGPGAWLARERGCHLIGVDVMEDAAAGARRLFSSHVAVGTCRQLPFRSGCFDAAWSLGVLETVKDKATALTEIRRVLAPSGRLGVFGFVAATEEPLEPMLADYFETASVSIQSMSRAGFEVVTAEPCPDLARPPKEWGDLAAAARDSVRSDHRDHPMLEVVQEQLARFDRLRSTGQVEPWLFVLARREWPCGDGGYGPLEPGSALPPAKHDGPNPGAVGGI
jgi:SAM-dependent methyltransferase